MPRDSLNILNPLEISRQKSPERSKDDEKSHLFHQNVLKETIFK